MTLVTVPRNSQLNYRSAGVDIDAGDAVVTAISAAVRRTHGPRVVHGLGHFGGFFRIGPTGAEATLVASTDSVGTKLKIAILTDRHEGIGVDLVHHCINDIVACGATPLFFLDYYATGRLEPEHAAKIVTGIAQACEERGVALIGGETAELPGIYAVQDYDVAGFIVGQVDAARIIDGAAIREGDILLGLPSNGFHTNGYSLVRAALGLNDLSKDAAQTRLNAPLPGGTGESVADALLVPHRCYDREVRALLGAGVVHGMAHITGGGIPGNVARIVPTGLGAEVDAAKCVAPAVMEHVIVEGGIDLGEAFRAFNMGVGYVVVVDAGDVAVAHEVVSDAFEIGRIVNNELDERVRVVEG